MRCRCGRPAVVTSRVVVATTAYDPDFAGFGSSPYLGDTGGFLPIPAFDAQRDRTGNRHLFRLTPTIEVASGEEIRIVDIWNYLTIREEFEVEEEEPADEFTMVTEREVVSPGWHFSDASASFHLRILTGSPQLVGLSNTAAWPAPSVSRDPFGGAPARLIGFPGPGAALGGKPPGNIVGSLGTQRYMAFPFTQYGAQQLSIPIEGPATIEYYASVLQTDPATRPFRPPPTPPATLEGERPEDQFVRTHTNVRYGHVGGALTYEVERFRRCDPCGGCRNGCCTCVSGGGRGGRGGPGDPGAPPSADAGDAGDRPTSIPGDEGSTPERDGVPGFPGTQSQRDPKDDRPDFIPPVGKP